MLLSKNKINTGRQIELDLLKAFTVVFSMIIIHVYDYDTFGFENDFVWWIDTIFGGIFAAPVFMFCMGVGMDYSRVNSAGQMAVRGLKLLTVGQLLNLFRYALIFGIQSAFDRENSILPAQALNFSSDIMQLAGLGFLLMALLTKLKMKNWMIFSVAVLLSLCGTLLEHVQTGNYAIDQFLGFFWGTETESFFPLFNWFIFIAAGKCFGVLYQRVEDKNKFFLSLAPVGIISFALVFYFQKHTSCTFFNSFDEMCYGFSWMKLQDALSVILMMPAVFAIFYVLSKILPEKTIKVLTHPSKHVNQYYCVSWCWIMFIYLFAWANSSEALISVWLNVVTFTTITVCLYNNHLKETVEAFCSKYRLPLTVAVWVITLGLAFWSFAVCTEFPNQFNSYLLK